MVRYFQAALKIKKITHAYRHLSKICENIPFCVYVSNPITVKKSV